MRKKILIKILNKVLVVYGGLESDGCKGGKRKIESWKNI